MVIPVLRQMLDHRFTSRHASAYVDGELSAADSRRVEQHTAVCPLCRELIASLRRMLEALPVLTVRQPGIADGVLDRLRRET